MTLAAVGCGGPAASSDVEVPRVEAPPTSGLVWVRDGNGVDHTHWVDLEGAPLVGQPVDGPLWADGHALWQLALEEVSSPTCEDEPDTDGECEPSGEVTLTRVVLRELVEDARVVVMEAPETGAVRDARHALVLEPSVGPYLFFLSRLYIDAWGAHGAEDVRQTVWDLRAASTTEIPTDRERASWAELATALAQDAENVDDDAGASAVALHPRWDRADGLEVELHVAVEACYACGDGEWSDYTVSVRHPLEAAPERLARELPAWARRVAERTDAQLMGFTRVEDPGPAAILDSLSRGGT